MWPGKYEMLLGIGSNAKGGREVAIKINRALSSFRIKTVITHRLLLRAANWECLCLVYGCMKFPPFNEITNRLIKTEFALILPCVNAVISDNFW
jgi:hypothetical protein